jgi:glycosyltransferase involved in cell wall biosynthesis
LLVSVVIPAHNRGLTIERAVQSVVAQTHQDLEVIVVDDASTDHTRETVAGLAQRDRRISLVTHSVNQGAQTARNTGIRNSHGSWIAFLDSDDYWIPESIDLRLALAKQENVSVVHSDCLVSSGNETKEMGVRPLAGDVWRDLLDAPSPLFPALLVRKTSLEAISLLDERIVAFQEWDTSIRLAAHYSFGFLNKPTFIYDCRGEDTISKDVLRNADGYGQVVKKHRRDILHLLGRPSLIKHYKKLVNYYRIAGNLPQMQHYLFRIIILQPNPNNLFKFTNSIFG